MGIPDSGILLRVGMSLPLKTTLFFLEPCYHVFFQKLVVKPDQLIKRRGKLNLIKVDATIDEVRQWIGDRMEQEFTVEKATGRLNNFIVEPFIPHLPEEEFYVW